jgi:hypothetical protein
LITLVFKPNRRYALRVTIQRITRWLRRGGRVVERTALEMRHTGNRIVGSNPTLSAIFADVRVTVLNPDL